MQEGPGKMTDAPRDPAGNHFPDFHHQSRRIDLEAELERIAHQFEKGIAAIEDAVRRNAAEWKAQRAVNEALEGWFAHGKDPATRRVLTALREALE